MKRQFTDQTSSTDQNTSPNFHGASIISSSGAEIPITEQMLQKAFKALIDAWEQSREKRQS